MRRRKMTSEAKVIRLKSLHTPAGSLPVAWVEVGKRKDLAVPLARLAEVVEYDLRGLRKLVDRDPVLRDFQRVVTTLSGNLKRTQTYLLRPGVLGVLVKISTSRIQDPAKRERIIAFQRWAFEALDRLLFEEFAPVPKPQAVLQPLFPSAPVKFKGDRVTAAAMLTGDVRRRDGSLYSYSEIARITGVPGTTLRRMADRLGVRHLRRPPALPTPVKTSDAELLRLLTDVLNRLYLHLAR
jgi:hypothetical protein